MTVKTATGFSLLKMQPPHKACGSNQEQDAAAAG
jgi:hypothetical protein